MGKKSEQGNVIELVIIGVLVVAVIGLLVWRFVDGSKKTSDAADTSTQTAQNTQTNSETKITEQSSTSEQTDPNKGYIVLDDWGVRFKPANSETVQYAKSEDAYEFTTATAQKINDCSRSYLWLVGRRTTKDEVMNGQIMNNGNKVGDHYYYKYHTQEMCAISSSDQTIIEEQIDIVENLLGTIEAKQ